MRFRDDERGVTVQVGAVLLLGIIVLSLSIYQVQVVPAQNEQVEFDHSQAVQTDLQQTRNAILGTGGGTSQPTAVQLGTRYPARAVFVNPPPVSGSLRTEDAGQFRIENAEAVNPETADYWRGESSGDAGFDKSFATDRLQYSADYAVYDNAPTTVYANSVVYNDFEGANAVTLSDQRLIDDRTISLVALDGRLSASQTGTVTVDPQAVSASTRTVAVENDGGPVTVTVPTELTASEWNGLLDDERVSNGGSVDSISVSGGELTVTLAPGVYRLRLAKVGVGTNVAGTSPTYLTTVEGPETTTPDTSQQFTVEVRDGYDNPVSGETVEATVDRGTVSPVASSLSDEDGRVTFEYTAPSGVGDGDVQIEVSYDDPTRGAFVGGNPQDISYTVDVESSGGGGGGPVRTDLRASDFEGSAGDITNTEWQVGSGSGGVRTDTTNSGTYAMYVGGNSPSGSDVRTTVDTTGYDRIEIGYWLREGDGTSGPEAEDTNGDEALVVEYRNADDEWVQLDRFNVTEGYPRYERLHEVTLSNAFHADFTLRFRQLHGDADGDRWYVDDVRIVGVGTGGGGGGGSNSDPSASFGFDPTAPTAGEQVDFDAGGSSDTDGSITSYEWDFGDGTTGSGVDSSHTFGSSGTYTVELTVTDDDGATDTTTQQVDVSSSSGTTVGYVAGSGEARVNGQRSGVRFTVENTGSRPAEIVGIEVSVAGGSARKINERNWWRNAPDQHEVYIQSSDNGILEMSGGRYFEENSRALRLDTRENLNDTAVVQPGDEATINTFEYRNNGGQVINNMGGRELTVTLYFADGTSRQYTFTATDPY